MYYRCQFIRKNWPIRGMGPSSSTKNAGITWFVRIRLTLRFELMCIECKKEPTLTITMATLSSPGENPCPSTALRKICLLSRMGDTHEDSKSVQKSVSTPEFVSYLGMTN